MATKKHNPGCPCCLCACFGTPGFFSRTFVNTPTVKVVVSGLPAIIEHTYVRVRLNQFFFTNQIFYSTYVGLDQLNGTYFFEKPKVGNCVRPLGENQEFDITFIRDEQVSAPQNNPCFPSVILYDEIATIATVASDFQLASVTAPRNAFVSISGLQLAPCRNDFIPPIDGLTNNGDIILSKVTNNATICDTRFRNAVIDSVVTEVIGRVTYEMLDLP